MNKSEWKIDKLDHVPWYVNELEKETKKLASVRIKDFDSFIRQIKEKTIFTEIAGRYYYLVATWKISSISSSLSKIHGITRDIKNIKEAILVSDQKTYFAAWVRF